MEGGAGTIVEDLAKELMAQIKKSNFLEQNPPQGTSIFSLAQFEASGESDADELAVIEGGAGGEIGGEESVEDLTRQLLTQLRSQPMPRAGEAVGNGASSGNHSDRIGLEDAMAGLSEMMQASDIERETAIGTGKKLPGLGDALETLLGALGEDGGQGGAALELSNDEDDEILAAFKAMRPTVDMEMKELKEG